MEGPRQLLPLAIALVLWCAVSAGAASILIQSLPGALSHQMAALTLGHHLRQRGHSVHALLADYDMEPLRAKGWMGPEGRGSGIKPIMFQTDVRTPQERDAIAAKYAQDCQDRPSQFLKYHLALYEQQCRFLLRDIAARQALQDLQADLAIVDLANPCSGLLAALLGVPWAGFLNSDLTDPFSSQVFGIPYTPAAHGIMGSGLTAPMTFLQRTVNTLLSPLAFSYGLFTLLASRRRLETEFGLNSSRDSLMQVPPCGFRLMLVNAAPGVSMTRSLPHNVKFVGPLLGSGPAKPLPTELDGIVRQAGERGVVYVSFGTAFGLRSCDAVKGLAAALSSLNRTTIWSISPTALPAGCPLRSLRLSPSVHPLPWVPQADLLAHPAVRAFVTHGGINSIHEAAYRSTPLVCIPLAADQFDGCAKVASSRYGLLIRPAQLALASAPELASAIEQVAGGASYATAAARLGAMLRAHPRSPVEQAGDWVEYALALPPGAQLADPAVLLPWWQRSCLDVYAFVGAALWIAFLMSWLAFRTVMRRLRRRKAPINAETKSK